MTKNRTYQLFIDGKWVDGESTETIDIINPATEGVIGTVVQATRADVARAIEAARRAFDDGPWPRLSVRERSAALLRMTEIMERRQAEIIDLNIGEAGSIRALAESIQ